MLKSLISTLRLLTRKDDHTLVMPPSLPVSPASSMRLRWLVSLTPLPLAAVFLVRRLSSMHNG